MADYRDWCGTCGAEINFGGHAKGCPQPARAAAAERERREERERRAAEMRAPWEKIIEEEGPEAFAVAYWEMEQEAGRLYEPYAELKAKLDAGMDAIRYGGADIDNARLVWYKRRELARERSEVQRP